MNIIDIIQRLLQLFFPKIHETDSQQIFIESPETDQTEPTIPENWIINKQAFAEALTHCDLNRDAFLGRELKNSRFRIFETWKKEEGYNWNLYLPKTQKKVRRLFDWGKGIITKSETIPAKIKQPFPVFKKLPNGKKGKFLHYETDCNGEIIKTWITTYCNHLVSIFTHYYCGYSLTYFRNKWVNANDIQTALATGAYDNDVSHWKEVDPATGGKYAKVGGLCVACWNVPGKIGHVAIVTGRDIDGKPGKMEIYQAGLEFGFMKLSKGFGMLRVKQIKYYIWVKNV